jgi:hypothetical protein
MRNVRRSDGVWVPFYRGPMARRGVGEGIQWPIVSAPLNLRFLAEGEEGTTSGSEEEGRRRAVTP